MRRFIQDFLWSLKSEESKRKEIQRGFDSVFEIHDSETKKREAFLGSRKAEWSRRIIENLIVGIVSSLLATALWFWFSPTNCAIFAP